MPSIGRLLETKVHHLIDHLLQRKHSHPTAPATAPNAPVGWRGNSEFEVGTPGAVRTPGAGPSATGLSHRCQLPDGFKLTASSMDLKDATASFTVPLMQVSPPMSAEMAKQIVGIRLPEPFAGQGQSVRFKVLGEGAAARLEVVAEHVDGRSFAGSVPLQLETRSGQQRRLEVASNALSVEVQEPIPEVKPGPGLGVPDTHFRVSLEGPIGLAWSADHRDATVSVSLPLSSLKPPMTAEIAREIVSARLPEPWAHGGQDVAVKVVGDALQLTAEHANPSAFRQVQAFFELNFKSGQFGVVEVGSSRLKLDDTAYERQSLTENIAHWEQSLARSRSSLEQTRAQLTHPETIPVDGSQQLAEARAELTALSAAMATRRSELREAMAKATVQAWAFAAELAFPEPGSPAEALHAEADGLWNLSNERVHLASRVDNLKEVIGQIDGDPELPADIKDAATRDLKAELAEKEPALAAMDDKIGAAIRDLGRHASELGLEDELLARGEFWLKQMKTSNEPGSFGRMLLDEKWVKGSVQRFEEQVEVNGKSTRIGLERYVTYLEKDIPETESRIAQIRADLAALDGKPVTHEYPTAYVR